MRFYGNVEAALCTMCRAISILDQASYPTYDNIRPGFKCIETACGSRIFVC